VALSVFLPRPASTAGFCLRGQGVERSAERLRGDVDAYSGFKPATPWQTARTNAVAARRRCFVVLHDSSLLEKYHLNRTAASEKTKGNTSCGVKNFCAVRTEESETDAGT
jgi:hypothetical protein